MDLPHEVWIDSRLKNASSTSTTNFTINFNKTFYNIDKLRLEYFQCPLTIYNINNNNNIVTFKESGVTKQATLTNGNYTGSQLADQLASKLTTASGVSTFTVTYDSKTWKLTLVSTN